MTTRPVIGPIPDRDPAAQFDRLLRPLMPVFFRHAFRWTAARDQAEDLVQELIVRLYPRLEELAKLDLVQPWALRVMYRIFVDQHRRSSRSPIRPSHELPAGNIDSADDPLEQFPDTGPQPPELVERELTATRLTSAWASLNEDQRVVVAMHDIEGYRLEEIAEMFDTPVGTLKSRLHRARLRLREMLEQGEPISVDVRVREQGVMQ